MLGKKFSNRSRSRVYHYNFIRRTIFRYDWRLKFVDLKNDPKRANTVNLESRNKIWLPNLVFDNSIAEVQIKNDGFSSLSVKREGNPVAQLHKRYPQATNEFQESEKFTGDTNPLVYARNYELKLGCEFALHYYPFDTQTCLVTVTIMNPLMSEQTDQVGFYFLKKLTREVLLLKKETKLWYSN